MSLILVKLLALALQVVGFTAILEQERVKNLRRDFEVLAIRLCELLEEPSSRLGVFILKLRVHFET